MSATNANSLNVRHQRNMTPQSEGDSLRKPGSAPTAPAR